jgi:glycosyltransferase involved in cell wall biosynthesis
MAQELGVLNKNLFMPGKLPKAEIPTVFSAADITTSLFIDLPEMWANSANKFFDGLASGTPIAINYKGWQAEVLKEYDAGIILPPHNYKEAAHILSKKISDQMWLKKTGNNARKLAAEKYDRDFLAQKLEHVLNKAVE